MNYNEMTAQQCADWLAEKDGCWFSMDREIGPIGWFNKDGKLIGEHPYPLWLDAAAGALLEPWRLAKTCLIDGLYNCTVWRNAGSICTIEDAPDELTARYRAAVAARMEEEPNNCSIIECLDKVRDAGGHAWDKVENPDAVLRGDEDAKEEGK